GRHHGRVHHAQSLETVDAQLGVDHASHRAGPSRVVDGLRRAAKKGPDVGGVSRRRPGLQPAFRQLPQSRLLGDLQRQPGAPNHDLEVMVRGTRLALEIAEQPALRKLTKSRLQPWPASADTADIRAFLRRATQTIYHPAGTCAMGSVVDSELRVHGFEGLRVVDASVMPTLVSGNTN